MFQESNITIASGFSELATGLCHGWKIRNMHFLVVGISMPIAKKSAYAAGAYFQIATLPSNSKYSDYFSAISIDGSIINGTVFVISANTNKLSAYMSNPIKNYNATSGLVAIIIYMEA